MGNHLIASSSESAAPIAPGKRDVANRGLETTASYTVTSFALIYCTDGCRTFPRMDFDIPRDFPAAG